MDHTLYFAIRQILMSLLVFLGMHMIFISLPKRVHSSLYKRSLRLMGFAFLIVPISYLLSTPEYRFDLDNYIAPAVNLTTYFATFILMSLAFLTLLGRRFSPTVVAITVAALFLFPLPLWVSLLIGDESLIDTVMTASYSYYVVNLIVLVWVVLYHYRKIMRDAENYYSDDVMICVAWVSKSIVLIIGLSLICAFAPILFACSYWVKFGVLIYGVLSFLHIYYGYYKMLSSMIERFIMVNISDGVNTKIYEDFDGVIKPEILVKIEQSLNAWIVEKGYTQKGITISDVSKMIGTNRTYLSKYINTTYNQSYKNWITQLRLNEAKIQLLNEKKRPVTDVVEAVGFASVESFTHVFTRMEGMPPVRWREKTEK